MKQEFRRISLARMPVRAMLAYGRGRDGNGYGGTWTSGAESKLRACGAVGAHRGQAGSC
jgi:hypothetical protein